MKSRRPPKESQGRDCEKGRTGHDTHVEENCRSLLIEAHRRAQSLGSGEQCCRFSTEQQDCKEYKSIGNGDEALYSRNLNSNSSGDDDCDSDQQKKTQIDFRWLKTENRNKTNQQTNGDDRPLINSKLVWCVHLFDKSGRHYVSKWSGCTSPNCGPTPE